MPRIALCLNLTLLLACTVPLAAQDDGPGSATTATAQLSQEQIAAMVNTLAQTAEQRYVDPRGGATIARELLEKLARGNYAALADPLELAARLTADLRQAVPDVHLHVAYEPNRSEQTMVRRPGGGAPAPGQLFARIDPRSVEPIARSNYGFEAVERLEGNVGYLRIGQFVPPDMSEPTARAAMEFLANSDAIIVDLRGNIGGSPELVRFLLSYFTGPEPMTLMTRYIREGDVTEAMTSLASVPGTRREGTPLHVLVDRRTASAAEMFAYLVQQHGLGTVHGETSSGAGQGGNMLPLGEGLAAFIPFTRIVDGPGWERTGVRPDVAAPAETVLSGAHLAALRELIDQPAADEVLRERAWSAELVEGQSRGPDVGGDIARFEGRFGTRAFKADGATLQVVGATGRVEPLMRVGETVFRTRSARYSFEAEGAGPASKLIIETLLGVRSEVSRSPVENN